MKTSMIALAVLTLTTSVVRAETDWKAWDKAFDDNGKALMDKFHFTDERPAFDFAVQIIFGPKFPSSFSAAHHSDLGDEVTAVRWYKSSDKAPKDYPFWGSEEPGTYGYEFRTEGYSFDKNLEGRLNVKMEKVSPTEYLITFTLTPDEDSDPTVLYMAYQKKDDRWFTVDRQANKGNGDEIDEIVAETNTFTLTKITTKRAGKAVGVHKLK